MPNNIVLISRKIVFSNLSVSLVNGFNSVGMEWALHSQSRSLLAVLRTLIIKKIKHLKLHFPLKLDFPNFSSSREEQRSEWKFQYLRS